jgi:hypothetical protein
MTVTTGRLDEDTDEHAAPASSPVRRSTWPRALLMVPAGLSLLVGLDAGLQLLGGPAPVRADRLPAVHGMLLVLGFVGTLVAVERAVALRRRIGFAAPALLGVGALLLVSPAPLVTGKAVLVAGAAALVALYVPLWRRRRDDAVLVQALGAVLATAAALLWLGGQPVPVLVPWLAGFVVLTIAGERLELARLAMGRSAGPVLVIAASVLVAAVTATLLWPALGHPLLGAALLALTGWLAVHDVARRTVRGSGAPRHMAACMLAGYAWLVVASGIWLLGRPGEATAYDAVTHAVFLGFTLSMIMAHAPTTLPAVLRRPFPYHPAMWVAPSLLHASLVVRVWLGDGLGLEQARDVGGVGNVAAVLLFLLTAAWSAMRAARAR